MSTAPALDATQPILRLAWEAMPQAMRRTVTSAPVIPQIAARAKAAAAEHPGFVRGDQGQVVGVMPDREVYYGPSSGSARSTSSCGALLDPRVRPVRT